MVARLPKLELKGFSGDPTTWMSFLDSFSSAVDRNDYLSEVDKFNHLKTLVDGAAATTIAGLSLTSARFKFSLFHIYVVIYKNIKLNIMIQLRKEVTDKS